MKSHYCEAEGTVVEYEGECNWCGEKEMNNKERAAMKLALEALEDAYENGFLTGITGLKTIDVLTALREALEQPVNQEPDIRMVRAIALEEAAQLCMDYGREGFDVRAIANAIRGLK